MFNCEICGQRNSWTCGTDFCWREETTKQLLQDLGGELNRGVLVLEQLDESVLKHSDKLGREKGYVMDRIHALLATMQERVLRSG